MRLLKYINDTPRHLIEVDDWNSFFGELSTPIIIKKEGDLISLIEKIKVSEARYFFDERTISFKVASNVSFKKLKDIDDFNNLFIQDNEEAINIEEDFLISLLKSTIFNGEVFDEIKKVKTLKIKLRAKDFSYIKKYLEENKNKIIKLDLYKLMLDISKSGKNVALSELNYIPYEYNSNNVQVLNIFKDLNLKNSLMNNFLNDFKNFSFGSFVEFFKNNKEKIEIKRFKTNSELFNKILMTKSKQIIFEDKDDLDDFKNYLLSLNVNVFNIEKIEKRVVSFLIYIYEYLLEIPNNVSKVLLKKIDIYNLINEKINYFKNNLDIFTFLIEEVGLYELYDDLDSHYLINELINISINHDIKTFYNILRIIKDLDLSFLSNIDENIKLFSIQELTYINKKGSENVLVLSQKRKKYTENVLYKGIIMKNSLFLKEILRLSKHLIIFKKGQYDEKIFKKERIDSLAFLIKLLSYL